MPILRPRPSCWPKAALASPYPPYQLIVPLAKKPARWVRQLTGLRVVKVQ